MKHRRVRKRPLASRAGQCQDSSVLRRKPKAPPAVLPSEYSGPSTALVEFYAYDGLPLNFAEVSWVGDEDEIPQLTGCYLDQYLSFTRPRRLAEGILNTFETYLLMAQASVATGGNAPRAVSLAVGLADPQAQPAATVRIELVMNFEKQRYGAITTFEPRRLQEEVADRTLGTTWDWSVAQYPEAAPEMVGNLLLQCSVYREHGLPRPRNLGKAPFYAGMKKAGDRLADELGEIAGITGDEFRRLPEAEKDRIINEHTRRELGDRDAK